MDGSHQVTETRTHKWGPSQSPLPDSYVRKMPGISYRDARQPTIPKEELMDGLQLYLVVATAVACGLVGGVFYAFSTFVMAGLERLPPEQGMAAMQSINVTAVQPGLMIPFFGTMAACVAVAISAILNWDQTVSVWLLVGAVLYAGGTFVMTGVYHVPRNNRLAATDPAAPEARSVWAQYLTEWTRWNHARTAASLGASLALTVAVHLG